MKPVDKFGKPIYGEKFRRLQANGGILGAQGYFESAKKPNLFCKQIPQGWFYADMRGTEEVPIWSDTRPAFYWKFNASTPMWERRRLMKTELEKLFKSGCPLRLFFYAHDSVELSDVSAFIDEENGVFDWDAGFCRSCSKDIQSDDPFCSSECKENYEDSLKETCELCGNKIEPEHKVRHHVSYSPEKVIVVHPGCHNKIHKTSEFPHLKPSREDISVFYSRTERKPTAKQVILIFLDEGPMHERELFDVVRKSIGVTDATIERALKRMVSDRDITVKHELVFDFQGILPVYTVGQRSHPTNSD